MATNDTITGSCTGVSGSKYNLWIEWKVNSQSVANNQSNITVTEYLQRNDGYAASAYDENESRNTAYLTVGEEKKVDHNLIIDTRNSANVTLATWTGNVTHGSDGKLTLALSGGFAMSAGLETNLTGGSVSGNATLPTIETIDRYPTAPTKLTAKEYSDASYHRGDVTITWKGVTGTVTKYKLQMAHTGADDSVFGAWEDVEEFASAGTSGTKTCDKPSTLAAGVKFKFRLLPYNGTLNNASKESNEMTVRGGVRVRSAIGWKIGTVKLYSGGWKTAKCVYIRAGDGWTESI